MLGSFRLNIQSSWASSFLSDPKELTTMLPVEVMKLVDPWSIFLFFFFCLFAFSRASPMAYEGSQARGLIGAGAAGLRQSHSNAESEPNMQPTPQLPATPDP